MTILEEIREIIVAQMDCDPASINENTNIVDDIGCDSLDVVEMLMAVEAKYGFELDNDEAIGLKTVGEVVKLIESKLN
ncbi:MAG: acyl carrier protein [Clostridia bacterium]|nr:acyl carrier protein [Clostridia bacterium]MBO7151945.1 acyl carrier protein [Clostridia bacterium]MBO7326032.1 acyl carrier protein [Clostridia bacterium]MBR5174105.1 acyl carrier protein [Clostridia bacterium]